MLRPARPGRERVFDSRPRLILLPYPRLTLGRRSIRLGPTQTTLLLAFMFSPSLTRDELVEICWPDPETMPETWLNGLRVRVCWLNGALRPFGWEVTADWGRGYTLRKYGRHARAAEEARSRQAA